MLWQQHIHYLKVCLTKNNRNQISLNVSYAKSNYDAVNPVFNKTEEDGPLGLGLFVFDKGLFNSINWCDQATAVWLVQQSNIDVYDQSSLILTAGVKYNF